MDNDSRGILFFILGFTCIWLVFDEFYGGKRISSITSLLTPNITLITLNNPDTIGQKTQDMIKNNKKLTPPEKKRISDALNPFSPSHGGALGG